MWRNTWRREMVKVLLDSEKPSTGSEKRGSVRVTEYVEFSFLLCRKRHSHPFLLSFSRNLILFVTVRVDWEVFYVLALFVRYPVLVALCGHFLEVWIQNFSLQTVPLVSFILVRIKTLLLDYSRESQSMQVSLMSSYGNLHTILYGFLIERENHKWTFKTCCLKYFWRCILASTKNCELQEIWSKKKSILYIILLICNFLGCGFVFEFLVQGQDLFLIYICMFICWLLHQVIISKKHFKIWEYK